MRPEGAARPPTLAAAQSALLSFITGGAPATEPCEQLIAGDDRASAGARIAVYAHMYRARLAEALTSQFPRLARALGPETFGQLAARYAEDHPSRHASLRFLGQHLPGWMVANHDGAPTDVGLAGLEWARADIFDLVDEPTLTADAVRAWAPARFAELPVRLIEAHRLVTVPAGTAARWDTLVVEGDGEGEASGPGAAGTAPESLVVWREDAAVYHRLVDGDELLALELAARGTAFGALCEGLLSTHQEADAVTKAYGWLSTWLGDGLLRAA